jgi:hypothetical protein
MRLSMDANPCGFADSLELWNDGMHESSERPQRLEIARNELLLLVSRNGPVGGAPKFVVSLRGGTRRSC